MHGVIDDPKQAERLARAILDDITLYNEARVRDSRDLTQRSRRGNRGGARALSRPRRRAAPPRLRRGAPAVAGTREGQGHQVQRRRAHRSHAHVPRDRRGARVRRDRRSGSSCAERVNQRGSLAAPRVFWLSRYAACRARIASPSGRSCARARATGRHCRASRAIVDWIALLRSSGARSGAAGASLSCHSRDVVPMGVSASLSKSCAPSSHT